jgi:glycosyltransferase involved in cell wall biosynthesis
MFIITLNIFLRNFSLMNIVFAVVKHISIGGGVEKYTEELGSRLVQMGHRVKVYSMKNYGAVPPFYKGMKIIPVRSVPLRQTEKLSASQIAGLMLSLSNWPDIVHFHSVSPGSSAWLVKLTGKKTLIQMHGLEWQRSRWGRTGEYVHRFLEKWSLLSGSYLTAVSRVQCDYFKSKYGRDVEYIPTGVDLKKPTLARDILPLGLQPKKYVLFASRLVQEKGAHYLIPAFRKIPTDYKLVLAGDVPNEDRYKKELLALASNDPRILFPGFVQGRLLEELFSNAAIYVQPSEIEGLSIALLEAMSYGLPCLVSDIPENIEAIADCGFTFVSRNIDHLSHRLSCLLENHKTMESLCKKAVHRVTNHYSWDSIADQFDELYRNILTNNASKTTNSPPGL